MSDRLKMAFEAASRLPAEEQEAFASFVLEELQEQAHWDQQFQQSTDLLELLAAEAREERRKGLTQPLDDLLK